MIRILLVLLLTLSTPFPLGWANAADSTPKLAEPVPDRYVVVPGDTLWDISARFLQEPWRWPEIWRMNREQIKNPHRIYPGDTIVLERDANGSPYLRLEPGQSSRMQASQASASGPGKSGAPGSTGESGVRPRIYEEQMYHVIPPIPPNVIEPFIATPVFVEYNIFQSAPRIVATQQDRVFLGRGDMAYVEGADPEQKHWQIFRNGQALYDPENPRRILGYEAFHIGSAVQARAGNPAIFEIDAAKQEIGSGDRLMPTIRPQLIDYIPHVPGSLVEGRVASIYGGVGSGGRLSIVVLNRGSDDGLEIGHVLAIERNRTVTRRDENDRQEKVVIPAERIGSVFVFRTFERVSYALVVQADTTVEVNDFIRTP
jgi:hypothetical protein